VSTLRVNTLTDVTGNTQPAMVGAAKAWVNFNGTGTVAIRASFNVGSITDNGTGDYTVNFANAMSDANYVSVASCDRVASGGDGFASLYASNGLGSLVAPTTTAARINTSLYNNSDVDLTYVCVAFFR
jgi:hypothetical protein